MSTKQTTAEAYGHHHMHEMNFSLPALDKKQAAQTIRFYKLSNEEGKQYGMVFKPSKSMAKTLLKKEDDIVTSFIQLIKRITKLSFEKIDQVLTCIFNPSGKLLEVVVTCKETASKLLSAGFEMLQFPRAVVA